jgi:hypothetical protein
MPSTRGSFAFRSSLFPVLTPSLRASEDNIRQATVRQQTSRESLHAKYRRRAPVVRPGDSVERALRMTRFTLVLMLCLMAWLSVNPRAQTATSNKANGSTRSVTSDSLRSAADVLVMRLEQLTLEIKQLRLELLEQRLDNMATTISSMERDLRQVHTARQSLADKELAVNREIAALDQQLREPTLAPDERAELENARASLADSAQTKSERASLAQSETELTERLHQVQQQRQKLFEKVKQLTTELARIQ